MERSEQRPEIFERGFLNSDAIRAIVLVVSMLVAGAGVAGAIPTGNPFDHRPNAGPDVARIEPETRATAVFEATNL